MKKISLLMVDDHDGFIRAVGRHLRRIEWLELVGSASNGREAIEMSARLHPDVVLMDMMMMELGGIDATREIKSQPVAPQVVLMSHFDDAEHRDQALNAGADQFISKMLFLEDIANVLYELIQPHEPRRKTNE
jgi:NarL family two-component system response regulator LiaR